MNNESNGAYLSMLYMTHIDKMKDQYLSQETSNSWTDNWTYTQWCNYLKAI